MKLERLSFLCLVAGLCAGADCAVSGPEDLCARWVSASCETLRGCCAAGERFHALHCQADLWTACTGALQASAVLDGEADFDRAAAEECLAPIEGCHLEAQIPETRIEACHNAAVGSRAPGAACSASSDCRRPDSGYAICYAGVAGNGHGTCADVVASTDGKCGFDAGAHVRTVCPEGQICDISVLAETGSDEPIYAFSADCTPPIAAGQVCGVGFGSVGVKLPCAAGLICDPESGGPQGPVCVAAKAEGQACGTTRQCAAGLGCQGMWGTCTRSAMVAPYCYVTPPCGDGLCEPPETLESCVVDCAICGDGKCSSSERWEECATDCPRCGDGVCDSARDETPQSCPDDCPH